MSVFGTRGYGKVDCVPGVCYVLTHFFHINFLPLIPIRSFLIIEEPGGGPPRGFRMPINLKSMAIGYVRGWSIGAAIIAGFFAVITLTGNKPDETAAVVCALIALAGAAAFPLSYLVRNANPQRTAELLARLGVSADPAAQADAPAAVRGNALNSYLQENPDALGKFSRSDEKGVARREDEWSSYRNEDERG
jgi:hypothetical protein